MSSETSKYLKFGSAVAVIVVSLIFLAYTGVQESKSYYVTIKELRGMGDSAYTKHLRVAGNVQPGSIKRSGTSVNFVLIENDQLLPVAYTGTEAPPDTFKDQSQALADGTFGRDGVFHARQLQAKCASKYAPQQPGAQAAPVSMSNVEQFPRNSTHGLTFTDANARPCPYVVSALSTSIPPSTIFQGECWTLLLSSLLTRW